MVAAGAVECGGGGGGGGAAFRGGGGGARPGGGGGYRGGVAAHGRWRLRGSHAFDVATERRRTPSSLRVPSGGRQSYGKLPTPSTRPGGGQIARARWWAVFAPGGGQISRPGGGQIANRPGNRHATGRRTLLAADGRTTRDLDNFLNIPGPSGGGGFLAPGTGHRRRASRAAHLQAALRQRF